ncbi:MAG: family 10 glycosylhydrolase [Planctomycetota bacterium]
MNTCVRRVALWSLMAAMACEAASAATPEVRGTWLTTTGVDHIRSGFATPAVMEDLRGIGLNTVYVETWKNGYTNFPSQAFSDFVGGAADRNTPVIGFSRDLVEETLIHAHRNQLAYVGWFEYGFASQFIGNTATIFNANPLTSRALSEGWLLRDRDGRYGNSSNGFAWMNPAVPEVRQLLIEITLEAIDEYDLDGIQFDDRLSWPREFGWDQTTADLYDAETGRSLPSSVDDVLFRNWRQGKVTQFAEELSTAVRAARPGVLVSVSPSITSFSDINFNAPWPEWQNDGLFDEYAVQVYRSNFNDFNSALTGQRNQFASSERAEEFVVGLRGNGSGANTPYSELERMLDRSRQVGAAGHAIFFSQAVRDDYPDQLTAYYDVAGDGHADNPQFGPNWRPPPEVGASLGNSQWRFDVDQASKYRVVARVGSFWSEVGLASLGEGDHILTVPGASQVELLLDRRPLEVADFNGDGIVDAGDYTLWRDTLGSTIDLRADADGDQVITLVDYERWRADFGLANPAALASGVSSAAAAVPEPAALAFAWAVLAWLVGRRNAGRQLCSRC